MIKVIFFGSSPYSVIVLQKLSNLKNFSIVGVFTKLDKPIGRKQEIIPNPVTIFTKKNNLPLFQIEEFTSEIKSKIRNLKPDLALCVAFGPPYFDQETINIPKYKIINIHPSPLPKYRGATPGPWQIINGETKSSVTFFQIDTLPDHGPIISQIPFDISATETATTFYDKAFNLATNNLENTLKSYISHPKTLIEQDHTQKSYFPRFTKESAKIDWSWDNNKIERFTRALIPWPIAWTYVTNQQNQQLKMKIFSFNNQLSQPAKVQIEGKTPTTWSQISPYYKIVKK
jgi:methionyl-tRNA formyltransferase